MIVKERLKDAESTLDSINLNGKNNSAYSLAYSIERLYSAYAWSKFIGKNGQKLSISKDALKESCMKKLSEAEERYQYLNLFLPQSLDKTKKELDETTEELEKGDYALCHHPVQQANLPAALFHLEGFLQRHKS